MLAVFVLLETDQLLFECRDFLFSMISLTSKEMKLILEELVLRDYCLLEKLIRF
jgi:hypothetical protein